MTIYLASDHAGFYLKEALKAHLLDQSYDVKDAGNITYEPKDDYPDFIRPAAAAVAKDPENTKAIIFGGSGQGEAIVANRYPGVRAGVYYGGPNDIVELTRQHNDANVLSFGARYLDEESVLRIADLWLNTEFSGDERHQRRIAKIDSGD